MIATMANQLAGHSELGERADEIISAQEGEISEMRSLQAELPDVEAEDASPMMMGEDHMGMDTDAMVMDPSALKDADSFDLAFIEMMIPHHEGVVEMAKKLLEQGQHPQLQEMAQAVIASQTAEIRTMRGRQEDWSGKPTEPKSGVEG